MTDSNLRIRLADPVLGEEELDAVRRVLHSGVLTNGAENEAFGREFAERHKARFGITFCTGTAALAAMLLAEGIGPGDEVIVPAMTFIATATAVCHVGATPVFADIDPRTFNLDPGAVAARITPATRAVMTVHYAGQPSNLDELAMVCEDAGVSLLEDAAQAAGAEYQGRPVGTFGRSAMFSFTPTKNITTGEGGIVLTDDPDVADRLKLLRNHGQAGLYRHESLGYNWRLTEVQAAIGRAQLRKLDDILERKRKIAASLTNRLAGLSRLTTPFQAAEALGTHMLYTCLLPGIRDQVLVDLLGQGIESRIYFPPAHRQPVFARQDSAMALGRITALPVTEAVADAMLSLPVHHRLTESDVAAIADAVIAAVDRAASPPGRADRADSATRPAAPLPAALANARLAYQAYEEVFSSDRWKALEAAGANPQRPLWASTGVKDPNLPDTLYVTELVAPGTVNTMPEGTLDATDDHGQVTGDTIRPNYADAKAVLEAVAAAGVDYDDVVKVLEDEGVEKFEISWNELLDTVTATLAAHGDQA